MPRTMTRPIFFLMLAALTAATVTLCAADFWETKDYAEWTKKESKKLLTNSPWARQVSLSMGGGGGRGGGGRGGGGGGGRGGGGGGGGGTRVPGGGYGGGGMAPPRIPLIIRWVSSLPVKQAMMRQRFGDEAATAKESLDFLNRDETKYILSVSGLPARMARMTQRDPDRFTQGVQLKRKKKEPIVAESMEVRGDEKGVEFFFTFPRTDEITLEDKDVEFEMQLGRSKTKRKFKLKDMLYKGELSL